jgi:thymidylate kinase
MILVILRGPAGAGKTSISEGLKDKIKYEKSIENEDIYLLNLDETKDIFETYMVKALNTKYVIGEMFSGNEHTTNPKIWINRFKQKNYSIFSFILKASIDICLQRCKYDEKKNRSERYEKELKLHKDDHNLFYNDLKIH